MVHLQKTTKYCIVILMISLLSLSSIPFDYQSNKIENLLGSLIIPDRNQEVNENRDFETTLNLAWEVLSNLTTGQLFRIHQKYLDKYYKIKV